MRVLPRHRIEFQNDSTELFKWWIRASDPCWGVADFSPFTNLLRTHLEEQKLPQEGIWCYQWNLITGWLSLEDDRFRARAKLMAFNQPQHLLWCCISQQKIASFYEMLLGREQYEPAWNSHNAPRLKFIMEEVTEGKLALCNVHGLIGRIINQ